MSEKALFPKESDALSISCCRCGHSCPNPISLRNHFRVHTGQSKVMGQRISQTRIKLGIAKGDRNPNFGDKPRPWLEGDNHPWSKWHKNNPDFGSKQRGSANPIHQVAYLYENPKYVDKITKEMRNFTAQKKGHTYEETYGPKKAAEYIEKLRLASPGRMAKFHRKETEPELIVQGLLEAICVVFQKQVPLGYYTVDFLLPDHKIVIQADGDYWHANPKIVEQKGLVLSRIQRDRRRLDASCDSYLKNRGYRVIRLWECDLHQVPEECKARIVETING